MRSEPHSASPRGEPAAEPTPACLAAVPVREPLFVQANKHAQANHVDNRQHTMVFQQQNAGTDPEQFMLAQHFLEKQACEMGDETRMEAFAAPTHQQALFVTFQELCHAEFLSESSQSNSKSENTAVRLNEAMQAQNPSQAQNGQQQIDLINNLFHTRHFFLRWNRPGTIHDGTTFFGKTSL